METPEADSPEFYRTQAQRVREQIGTAIPEHLRAQIEAVAIGFERLAERSEWRRQRGR